MNKLCLAAGVLAVMPAGRALAAGAAVTGNAGQEDSRPNIILFLVDDMGLMDTSLPFITDSKGKPSVQPLNGWYRTPNMERLAAQGIRFSTFYAQSVSSPSRACLMTGQNAARHGTTNWINSESNNRTPYGPKDWNWLGIRKSTVTLPSVLRSAGYKTIHVGKAHFGPIGSEGEYPQNIGFDVNIAGCSIGQPGSYYGEWGYGNIKGNKKRAVPGLEKYCGTDTFLSDALTIEADRQIDTAVAEGRPFFLYMAHYAVHAPFEADKRFIGNYAGRDLPSEFGKSKTIDAFSTLIEGMDKSLGDIMDHLEELGIAGNTVIIFLGDNGSDAPIGQLDSIASSAPLRGKKGTKWEGGMRVPFIAAWASPDDSNPVQREWKIERGAVQTQIGTVNDIFPTILELAGARNLDGHVTDGYSLKKEFSGSRDRRRSNEFLMHFPHAHNSSYFTVYRDGDWKLIYNYHPETGEPVAELYNLATDPQETTDLSMAKPRRCSRMTAKMFSKLKEQGAKMCETE